MDCQIRLPVAFNIQSLYFDPMANGLLEDSGGNLPVLPLHLPGKAQIDRHDFHHGILQNARCKCNELTFTNVLGMIGT